MQCALFVLLGAATNVALAWACAAWVDTSQAEGVWEPAEPDGTAREFGWVQARFGHSHINWIILSESAGEHWQHPGAWRDAMRHPDGQPVSRGEDWAGWPMRSMMSVNEGVVGAESAVISAGINIEPAHGIKDGIVLMPRAGVVDFKGWRALPLRPMWPGFAVSTLFHAALLGALWYGPGAVRRRVRRARGACACCGYDLRGSVLSSACPECGARRVRWRHDRPRV
jgi:hypothetical protein